MANLKEHARSRKQFKEFGCSEQGSVSLLKESMNRDDAIYTIRKRGYETLALELVFSVFREAVIDEAQRYFEQTGNIMRLHLDGSGPKETRMETCKRERQRRTRQFMFTHQGTCNSFQFILTLYAACVSISMHLKDLMTYLQE